MREADFVQVEYATDLVFDKAEEVFFRSETAPRPKGEL